MTDFDDLLDDNQNEKAVYVLSREGIVENIVESLETAKIVVDSLLDSTKLIKPNFDLVSIDRCFYNKEEKIFYLDEEFIGLDYQRSVPTFPVEWENPPVYHSLRSKR